jgi:shikimate dehydrogenase
VVTAHTSRVGLVSWPVGHSLSPVMQNKAFEFLGLDWVYLPLPVQPGNLEAAVKGLVALNFAGCNISVPHKSSVLPYVDEKTAEVSQMNATNTLKIVDGKVVGYNTDPDGFIRALRAGGFEPQDTRVMIIGAGGAARAAVYGLSQIKGVQIHLVDVVEQQGVSLVEDMQTLFPKNPPEFHIYSKEVFDVLRKQVDLVVNASPVGMRPNIDASPWPDDIDLPDQAVFFDMVYNPLVTRFLDRAAKSGQKTISGLGMLVNQGALSFEIWTGQDAPIEVMYEACRQAFAN